MNLSLISATSAPADRGWAGGAALGSPRASQPTVNQREPLTKSQSLARIASPASTQVPLELTSIFLPGATESCLGTWSCQRRLGRLGATITDEEFLLLA
jgi:hypothetical protein